MKLALEIINMEIAQRKLANKHDHLRKEICTKEIEELESVVNLLSIPIVSQRSELLIALKECRRWMINKGVNVESEFFKNIDKAINCG